MNKQTNKIAYKRYYAFLQITPVPTGQTAIIEGVQQDVYKSRMLYLRSVLSASAVNALGDANRLWPQYRGRLAITDDAATYAATQVL